jgi:hypothetical protein
MLSIPRAIAQEVVNPSLAPALPNNPIARKVVGKWSVTNPDDRAEKALLIFTPQGEVYRLEVLSTQPQARYRLLTPVPSKYEIMSQVPPVKIKVKTRNNAYVGIWELVNDRQLKLKQITTNSHRRRFTQKALILTKIAEDPSLPPNLENSPTVGSESTNQNLDSKKPELVARLNLKFINRVQRVYHNKYDRFAPTFDRLNISKFTGVTDANPTSRSYTYRLVSSNRQRAIITAQPQEANLHSYTAAIYSYPQPKARSSMTSIICESDRANDRPPGTPMLVKSGNDYAIKCAGGFHPVKP